MIAGADTRQATAGATPRSRRQLLVIAIWCVLAVVFYARFRHEVVKAVLSFPQLGPAVAAALVLFVIWTVVASEGWRVLLRAAVPDDPGAPTLARLSLIRVQAQAVNFVLPTGGLAGEGLRAVSAAGTPAAVRGSVAAIVLDNVATGVAGLTISAATIPLLLAVSHAPWHTTVLSGVALVALAVLSAWLPFALAPRLLRVVDPARRVARVLQVLSDHARLRPAFRRAVLWHFLERIITVGEVYVVFVSLRVPGTAVDAAVLSSVFILASFALFFIPGQIGAAELLLLMACLGLGLPPAIGISVALVRRSRQLAVSVVGLLLLLAARRTGGRTATWLSGGAASDKGEFP